ncbi:MAG: T9SS type A sorting domain-containing protein [Crocinitomicaceae bacterium]|nr:T9SS type A sorting domain-containing protein [Crocinitomicaceae bacterium]MBP6033656.1 T9SS type A sorting domain-containing protein [Crocinitomicaceae bacterium]
MKKLLILSLSIFLLNAASWAQSCTPGANYVDSTYGVWPDTTQNLPSALVNAAYSADINFKVPSTVTAELDATGQFVGSPIQGFTVTGLTGLPAGYNYACNISSCTYAGGANGCANIYGTTATAGTYPITIEVSATVLVILFPGLPPTPITQPVSFPGYKIVVGTAGIIEGIISPISVSPNPANASITVNGITASLKASEISLTNIEGKTIETRKIDASSNLTFDTSELTSGIYFIHVAHANGVEIVKFLKN